MLPVPLFQDVQEAQWFSKEGASERLSSIDQWTCKWHAIYEDH